MDCYYIKKSLRCGIKFMLCARDCDVHFEWNKELPMIRTGKTQGDK